MQAWERIFSRFDSSVRNSSRRKGKKIFNRKRKIASRYGVTKPNYKRSSSDQDNDECFFYREIGHWKRNCKIFLDFMKQKKLGEFFNEKCFHDSSIKVLDTGCSFSICNMLQDFRSIIWLKNQENCLQVRKIANAH